MRSAEITLPGFIHDICSAVHPLGAVSPFFKSLPLNKHGLEFIYPPIPAAHPLDDGSAAALYPSVNETAEQFEEDEKSYTGLMQPLLKEWSTILPQVLRPLHFPMHPMAMMRFGRKAITPATYLISKFHSTKARGLFAGMAAHSIQPLSNTATSAIALVFMLAGHSAGWPIAKGGSGNIANALASYFTSIGGKIQTDLHIGSLNQLPSCRAIIFDLTPKQLLAIAEKEFSSIYKWQLGRFRYGSGIFKIDWALEEPIPFSSPLCRQAGTIHLGNTFEEIAASEEETSKGKHSSNPFVLLAQQSVFDASRAPQNKHTAWAYCHVPNGSTVDMTEIIEKQVERFAPGFKKIIMARHVMNSRQVEEYNPNYIGGDINGGIQDLGQLFTRPALRLSPYRTSAKGIYICSSSTPPGGGVHGMCGYHAAKRALKDIFHLQPLPLINTMEK
jgi:phytoene dehydrogenase-like protein